MATAGGLKGLPASSRPRTFADMVSQTPIPLPEVVVPVRAPKVLDGDTYIWFSQDELDRSAQPFRYSLVLKFIRQRPSLDTIRAFIRTRWGLNAQPVVSSMKSPRHVFLRFAKEDDYHKAYAREACEIEGSPYRMFKWSTDFSEESEPSLVPVWVVFPGLPPNFYHESYLRNLALPIGTYLRSDNSTRCANRTDGARICIEMDAATKPIDGFWIGVPRAPSSRYQAVLYETLPAYCCKCKMQGHNLSTCKKTDKNPGIDDMGKSRKKRTLEMKITKEGEAGKVEEPAQEKGVRSIKWNVESEAITRHETGESSGKKGKEVVHQESDLV
ncbi:uncharacterized protein LOC122298952 [Carya illinoinensis]|uniref:uncharacterized protein LOC122298952 n=1 Tax=Carya illinoinensis TaxID=32201 RepID=UPI001C71EE32|nr:uncharacterized protein LOC122298952 [Carya illinoinensis]